MKSSLTQFIPKAVNESLPKVVNEVNDKIKDAVVDSLPSYRDNVADKSTAKLAPEINEFNFIITGASEKEPTYFKQLETDSKMVEMTFLIWFNGYGQCYAIRRLEKKINSKNNKRRSCRPLLISTTNSYFLQKCFTGSHHLQSFSERIYIKKYLTSDERKLEKPILARRYAMMKEEGKKKEDFKIKFYKDNLFEIQSH